MWGSMRHLTDFEGCSTQIYVEAEAKWDTYTAQDGSQRTALNLLQRMDLP